MCKQKEEEHEDEKCSGSCIKFTDEPVEKRLYVDERVPCKQKKKKAKEKRARGKVKVVRRRGEEEGGGGGGESELHHWPWASGHSHESA